MPRPAVPTRNLFSAFFPKAIEPAYPRSPSTARKAYGFHERQTVVALGTRPRFTRYNAIGNAEVEMARAGLLWLLGIPIPILLIMWAFGWLH